MEYSLKIETSQNVGINFQLASAGERSLAWFIDFLIKLLWILITTEIFEFIPSFGFWAVERAIVILPVLFYNISCELFMNGQTIGKALCKTRVIKLDGSAPSLGNYLMRWVFGLFEFNIFMGLGLIVYFWTDKGQRLGDIFAGTTVVKQREEITLEETTLVLVPEGYVPTFPQAEHLSNRDIETIKEGIMVYHQFKSYQMLNQLAHQVANTLNIKTQLTQLDFLDTVVNDYNYYQQLEY